MNVGYILLIFREDIPELFDWLAADLTRLTRLPIIFETPETNYHVEYLHKETKVTKWFGREVIHSPQICFLTSDPLTTIELQHDWEQLINEAKKEANKEKQEAREKESRT